MLDAAGGEVHGSHIRMLSTSCNRALFIGIAVDSLKAHRRAWGQYMACESRPNSPKREKIRECALKHAIVALTFSCNVKNEQLPGRVTGFGSTHMVKNPP